MSIIPNINNKALQLLPDIALWKQQIADAINYKGVEAGPTQAFSTLAEEIKDIPNFNTNGCEYINEVYKPTTLLEAYYNRYYLKSVIDNYVEEISGSFTFANCNSLQSVQMPSLVTISGSHTFASCNSLQSVQMPSLVTISGESTFTRCNSLQSVQMPSLVTISGTQTFISCNSLQSVQMPSLVTISGTQTFLYCSALRTITFGTLITFVETFSQANNNLRNITIGQGTDINLPFQYWKANAVISEGQTGIDELNENLYNNLLTKLYDHSEDGQTRTLRLGWLAHVTQENIDYANSKGWTLTT